MKDQLRNLLALQAIDTKVRELEGQLKALPARLDAARRDLAKLEAMLAAEKGELAKSEAMKRQQEVLLEREHDAHRAAKGKLGASKTGKEFHAANRELDYKKKSIIERDAELRKLLELIAAGSAQVAAHERDVELVRQSLAGEEAAVAAASQALSAEIAEVGSGRQELRGQVDKELLKTYDSLATKRGYSVAPVAKGVCQGCHTTLPPQMNNTLARGETVERCPRCLRIVYRPEAIDPPPAPAAEPSAAEPPAAESQPA